jgi:hypothetical protein
MNLDTEAGEKVCTAINVIVSRGTAASAAEG